uniref:Uncharacterized protein n=1 Tax=Knipowitschia caucasica TaxID=637954 RepID=A0AAV2L9Z7_KNICA
MGYGLMAEAVNETPLPDLLHLHSSPSIVLILSANIKYSHVLKPWHDSPFIHSTSTAPRSHLARGVTWGARHAS